MTQQGKKETKAIKLNQAEKDERYREHLRRVAGPAKVGGKK